MVLFAAAGGAAAYVLVIAPDKTDGEAEAPARNGNAAVVSRGDQADQAANAASEGPEATDDASAAGAAPGDQAEGAEGPPSAGDFEAAERALRDHYEAIDEGNYQRALERFHPDYRSSRAGRKFVALRKAGRPAIDLGSLAVTRLEGGSDERVTLQVDLVVADTAGADRKCRHFMGPVQMEVSGGEWTYSPGGPGEAQPGLETVRISPKDARCARVSGRQGTRPRGSTR